jgi:hypothetical protein
MAGWIYDHRQELESNIWLMPPLYHRAWQWIKYSVNHAKVDIPNRDGSMTTIYPGQRATSYRQIAKGIGYYEGKKWKEPNVKTIKSILDWMVKQNMISVRGNTEGSIITIEKWELYQSEMVKGNTKRITQSTRSKHVMDTNNECLINDELMTNECIKNNSASDEAQSFFEECWNLYPNKRGKGQIKDKAKKTAYALGEEFKRVIKRYDRYVKSNEWLKYQNGSTFWNGGYIDYLDEVWEEPKQQQQQGPQGVKYTPVGLKREGSMFD